VNARQSLLTQYAVRHPDDLARQVDTLPPADVGRLLADMDATAVGSFLPHLATAQAAQALAAVDLTRGAAILRAVDPDLAASLLRRIDPTVAAALLDALPETQSAPLRALLAYPPDSAGGVMDPLVLTAPLAATVADVRALVATHADHLYYYLYVVDAEQRLAGVLDLAELLQAAPEAPLSTMTRTNIARLPADLSLDGVFAHSGWRLYDALPVVDAHQRFLGVIRHRRMRHLLATRKAPVATEPGVRTVMALGEIYWLGLCGLLQGLAATASAASAARETP
jgi:magnesium transporter